MGEEHVLQRKYGEEAEIREAPLHTGRNREDTEGQGVLQAEEREATDSDRVGGDDDSANYEFRY